MKILLRTLIAVLFTTIALAGPVELKVEQRTLDREEATIRPKREREELIKGLKVTVRNTSGKPMGEGEVEWAMLVQRPGAKKSVISTGKEKLAALGNGQSATLNVGGVQMVQNRDGKQDLEYKVVVRHGAAESAKAASNANFDALAKGAAPLEREEKPKKEKKEK